MKMLTRHLRFCVLVGLFGSYAQAVELQDGDIIFQRSQSRQAQAIAAATRSDYTHMGVIFSENKALYVYEAIQPVVKTPLDAWIKRGEGGRYVVKRLRDTNGVDFKLVKREVEKHLGKDYDWLFEWSDKKIYCSELVWKAYKNAVGIEIGVVGKLRDFKLDSPVVRQLMRERYGKKIPLEMQVVPPSSIFASSELVTVRQK